MKNINRAHPSSRGFTLIELSVAVFLFLIVVSMATAVFLGATKTQRTALGFLGATQNVSQALEQIERELRLARFTDILQQNSGSLADYEKIQFFNPDIGSDLDGNGFPDGRFVRYERRVAPSQFGNIGYIERILADDSAFTTSIESSFITGDQADIVSMRIYCLTNEVMNTFPFPAIPRCDGLNSYPPSSVGPPRPYRILIIIDVQSPGTTRFENHYQIVITPREE